MAYKTNIHHSLTHNFVQRSVELQQHCSTTVQREFHPYSYSRTVIQYILSHIKQINVKQKCLLQIPDRHLNLNVFDFHIAVVVHKYYIYGHLNEKFLTDSMTHHYKITSGLTFFVNIYSAIIQEEIYFFHSCRPFSLGPKTQTLWGGGIFPGNEMDVNGLLWRTSTSNLSQKGGFAQFEDSYC